MQWSEFVRDYLNFTRKERIGILIVAALILICYFLPTLLSAFSKNEPIEIDTVWIAALKRLEIKDSGYLKYVNKDADEENALAYQYDRRKSNFVEGTNVKVELFNFDPNTISSSDWQRLGLRDKTIRTIQNYLSKGGHFYKPEDLQKIYGLNKDNYERLLPFVRIASKTLVANEQFVSRAKDETKFPGTYTSKYSVIDINTADTSALISLPGIGSKLALRIVTFREKLGGFYSIDQVGETYGLQDSIFQKIKQYLKLENTSLKKININTAAIDEMKAHPYIKFSLANPIIAYRNEHGAFAKVEDIKKVMAVTDEIYQKISPYLSLQ